MEKQDNLTEWQKEHLASYPDDRMVILRPWDSKGLEKANQIVAEIKRIEPNLEIMLVGSIPLKISGQKDIDLVVYCRKAEQSKHISNFKSLFGEPTRIGKNNSSFVWDFQRDGFKVSVWLADPTVETVKKHVKIFNILNTHPDLLKEYEDIKEKTKNFSYKEYQRRKYEFYNRILEEFYDEN